MDFVETDDLPFRLVLVQPGSAQRNPLQYKEPTESQKAALRSLIFDPSGPGWAGVGLINDRRVEDGWSEEEAVPTWIDGHTRDAISQEQGEPLPALVGSWSPEDERTILATLDPLAAEARTDPEAFLRLLETLPEQEQEVELLLDKMAAEYSAVDFLEEFGDGLPLDEEEGGGEESGPVASDTIRITVYDFDQVADIISGVRDMADERGWEIDVELQ